MRVNTKSGWFKLSVVLVSIAVLYVSCNFRPIFLKPKFTVWQPKQLEYTGELVEKWSFGLPSTGEVKGYVRKDCWKIEQNGNTYFVGSGGVKMDMLGKGAGFDDANSQARVEKFLGSFSYFDNSWNILSFWSKYCYVGNYIAKDDYVIVVEGKLNESIRKIDISSGKTIWSKQIG
ncbi:MAG: hypothetical protein KA140_07745 [Caldisericia bacterium]|nr:hypothetical protein [Caldisericia bacterium]